MAQKITSLENIDEICVEQTAVYNIKDQNTQRNI